MNTFRTTMLLAGLTVILVWGEGLMGGTQLDLSAGLTDTFLNSPSLS